jgi:hypothetical protein
MHVIATSKGGDFAPISSLPDRRLAEAPWPAAMWIPMPLQRSGVRCADAFLTPRFRCRDTFDNFAGVWLSDPYFPYLKIRFSREF